MENTINITRQEAIARGLKLYFVGKVCIRGHVAVRHLKTGCLECGKMRRALKRQGKLVRPEGWMPKKARIRAEKKARRLERERLREERVQANEAARLMRNLRRQAEREDRERSGRIRPVADKVPAMMRIAFDIVAMRPGSPRMQLLKGCTEDAACLFPRDSYLDEDTQYMRVYPLDAETHKRIALKVHKAFPSAAILRERARRSDKGVRDYSAEWEARKAREGITAADTNNEARRAAMAAGQLHYNDGRACKRGHYSDRLTSTGYCLECKRNHRVYYETVLPHDVREFYV